MTIDSDGVFNFKNRPRIRSVMIVLVSSFLVVVVIVVVVVAVTVLAVVLPVSVVQEPSLDC